MDFSLDFDRTPNRLKNTDDEILVRAAKHNRTNFTPLYQRYFDRVYSYIYNRVRNNFEAEDLTIQVFIDAMESLPRYHARGQFAGWLFTLAYRRCADYFRKPTTEPLNEDVSGGSDPVEQVIQSETSGRLAKLVEGLNETDQELLRLRYSAELSYSGIAYVLGKNEGAVKMALLRLLQRIKSQWEIENG